MNRKHFFDLKSTHQCTFHLKLCFVFFYASIYFFFSEIKPNNMLQNSTGRHKRYQHTALFSMKTYMNYNLRNYQLHYVIFYNICIYPFGCVCVFCICVSACLCAPLCIVIQGQNVIGEEDDCIREKSKMTQSCFLKKNTQRNKTSASWCLLFPT